MFTWGREQFKEHGASDDFAERLAESGLTVEARPYELSTEDCRLFGVTPESSSYVERRARHTKRRRPQAGTGEQKLLLNMDSWKCLGQPVQFSPEYR